MTAAALFSSAQSLFGGSKLAGSYFIAEQVAGRTVAGLWTIQRATHKASGKAVSVWTFDKGHVVGGPKGRTKLDATIEVLKKEVHNILSQYLYGGSSAHYTLNRFRCCRV